MKWIFLIGLAVSSNSFAKMEFEKCYDQDEGSERWRVITHEDRYVFIRTHHLDKNCESNNLMYYNVEKGTFLIRKKKVFHTIVSHIITPADSNAVDVMNRENFCGMSDWKYFVETSIEKTECLLDGRNIGDTYQW